MIDVCKLLYEICEDKRVYDKDFDLLASDVLDSFAMIELFTALEDEGIMISPTRVDRAMLQTPRRIEELIRHPAWYTTGSCLPQ